MNEKAKAQFVPFNALNEFMLADFRRTVIHETLAKLDQASEEKQKSIKGLIRKTVKVHGFRNSAQAPLPLKVNGAISSFEKSADFVKNIIQAWSEIKVDTRHKVFEFLTDRNWKLLPEETDRGQLPGFLTRWPAAEDFEVLVKAYREKYPEDEVSDDDICLMLVWLSGRLPVDMVEDQIFDPETE
jgi:hypothetical protein